MSRATPPLRDLARRLLAYEAKGKKATAAIVATVEVCESFRAPLAALMGRGGFRALLARALVQSVAELAWLHAVRVNELGLLEGLDSPEVPVEPEEMMDGSAVLVAHLLALLVAFIGEKLTLRLVREAWPKVALSELDFTHRENP
jgi:hypothetical protein